MAVYPYSEAKFQEHLAMMNHEKYERFEKYQVRIDLKWGGEYAGHAKPVLSLTGSPAGKEELFRNTLGFITGHFQSLYEASLAAMLPVFGPAGVGSNTENGVVKTPGDLHAARMTPDFIYHLQVNLDDRKEDIAVFSFLFRLKYEYEAPEDGCEFVFDHDRLLFWGDGNMGEHIHDYASSFWNGSSCEFLGPRGKA